MQWIGIMENVHGNSRHVVENKGGGREILREIYLWMRTKFFPHL